MRTDSRGGHNQKKFNKDFFKRWTADMAYTLGFAFADGCLLDARKSSRCCYLKFYNNDLEILEKMKRAMESNHEIERRKESIRTIRGRDYFCKAGYSFKIGSKPLFQDLIDLGLRPDKSLVMKFPEVPNEFLSHFVRGHFDGDGCVCVSKLKTRKKVSVQVVFVSGSEKFLFELSKLLSENVGTTNIKPFKNSSCFRICYKWDQAMKVLAFMYQDLDNAIYLERKYQKYRSYLQYLKEYISS